MPDQPSDLSSELQSIRERLATGKDKAAKERGKKGPEGDRWEEVAPGMSIRRPRPKRIEPPQDSATPRITLPNFTEQQEELAKQTKEASEAMAAARREKIARERKTLEATEAVAAELRRANENDEATARRDRWMVGLTALSGVAAVAALIVAIALR